MKTAEEFIIKRLQEWTKKFKGIQLKYAYDRMIEFHIVEVGPEEIRNANEDYLKAETELWCDMADRYPDEDIQISKHLGINDMTNILYDNKSWSADVIECSPLWEQDVCFDIKYDYSVAPVYGGSQELMAA